MHGRQLYFILTMAALTFIVGALTLGGVLRKPKDGSEPTSLASVSNRTKSSATQNPTLELVTVSPSLGLSMGPSPQPTGELNTIETIEPSNLSTFSPTTTSPMYPSPSPSLGGLTGKLPTLTPGKIVDDTGGFSGEGTRFYAIGDVPYTDNEAIGLQLQIGNLPNDAEFLIHVGDIRSARDGRTCEIEEYYKVAGILNKSHAPVFLLLGDNEWNDCPNIDEGFDHWMTVFERFDEQWNHSFSVVRHTSRKENFYFVHKRTLFFGLNLVGGSVQLRSEWHLRLQDLYHWVSETVNMLFMPPNHSEADSVVIFGHANPRNDHADFFDPLTAFLSQDFVADIPFLYLNGDAHVWDYTASFYGQSNLLRIQVQGGVRDPPLQMSLDNTEARRKPLSEVFRYDRMLPEVAV